MAAQTVPPAPPATEQFRIELPKYRRPGEPERYRLSAARLSSPKDAPLISLVVCENKSSKPRYLALMIKSNSGSGHATSALSLRSYQISTHTSWSYAYAHRR